MATESAETKSTSTGLVYDEVHGVISDLHLSAGSQARLDRGLPWYRRAGRAVARILFQGERNPAVSEVNPLEDFPDDRPLVEFVRNFVDRYAGRAGKLKLKLLGDTFDFHAVYWNGRTGGPPHQAVAVVKLKRIMAGHVQAMDALSAFVRRPDCRLDFFIGNHDLSLVWPQVQRRLVRRLAGDDPEAVARIRFIGPEQDFRELDRGILYYHGMNAEAQNSVYPKTVFIRHQFGLKLKRPILNEPLGSFVASKLAYRIKLHHVLIGRLADYRSVFRNAAVHAPGWSLLVLATAVWTYVYHAFFALAHIRRKTRLKDLMRTVGQAVTNEGVDAYARKQLNRPGVRAVVLGHSHEWRQVQDEHGTYVNTGTWALMFRLVERPLVLTWKRFRWLERTWLCLKHFLLTRDASLGAQVTKILGWLAATALLSVLLWNGFPNHGWFVGSSRWMIDISLAFVFLSGLLRVLSIKSEVESIQRYTFCLTKFYPDGGYELQLMEFLPDAADPRQRFRQCH